MLSTIARTLPTLEIRGESVGKVILPAAATILNAAIKRDTPIACEKKRMEAATIFAGNFFHRW
ncbi:MAG TPA: hypothetical protein VF266_21960 [Thermoanaerobaculia bacterium]